jgi:galactose mutarotase-like enzyme
MHETIENHKLRIRVAAQGAELVSLQSVEDDTEFLWQADPAIWGRHAPVLFPIVGMLRDNRMRTGGAEYQMSQHGFARDSRFELVGKMPDGLIWELADNDQTRKVFPFPFLLRIGYRLVDNRVGVTCEVANPSDAPLPFSLGAHPGFACPIGGEGEFGDYRIRFDHEVTAERWTLQDGLIADRQERFLEGVNEIRLSDDLFADGALVFKGFPADAATLERENGAHRIRMEFAGFPFLGIWSKGNGAPFVCIEPWYGIADAVDYTGSFENREGTQRLEPGGSFRCSYTIQIG